MNSKALTFFWFRRDLRLQDNTGLSKALSACENVQPVFIFDTDILSKLPKDDARVTFIHDTITELKQALSEHGSDLWVYYGKPEDVWQNLLDTYDVEAIYLNHDYEPAAIKRDRAVAGICQKCGPDFFSFKDHVIFEKDEVLKPDGLPYTIFTPYSKRWKMAYEAGTLAREPEHKMKFENFHQVSKQQEELSLADIGFERNDMEIPAKKVAPSLIKTYDETRDFPAVRGTSRLGVHLRFGTISVRQLAKKTGKLNETYLNELIWRDFYAMILWHFPHVVSRSFKPKYDLIPWENDMEKFEAWKKGETGYPIVDAGMRELNETGYMHNRVRMVVASFLCKHLLIDWRLGELYFAQKLLDYDLASNNGGWQWAAGCGCDAAPYFRVFSPDAQTKKFDEKLEYINTWVKDLNELSYPEPIVEHKVARLRAIEVYKSALNSAE